MKHLFIALFFFLILCPAFGQNNIVKTAGVSYTAGAPTFTPGRTGSQVAIDTVTGLWYEHNGTSWSASGYRVQTISGCSAPAYTPAKYQSRLVINACTAGQGGPELYYYTGSVWLQINEGQINEGQTYTAGTGIDITGTVITNTAPNVVQTLSIAGQDLSLSGGGGTVAIPSSTVSEPENQLVFGGPGGVGVDSDTGATYASRILKAPNFRMLPTVNTTTGIIYSGNNPIIHFFAPNNDSVISDNIFIGLNTGNFTMASGSAKYMAKHNTIIGGGSGTDITTGYLNTVMGWESLRNCTTCAGSIAIGGHVLENITTPHDNIGMGDVALRNATTGKENTAIGYESLSALTTGENNTALGHTAGSVVTGGSFNTFLGHGTTVSGGVAATVINSTAVGKGATITKDNQIVLGTATNVEVLSHSTIVGGKVGSNLRLTADGTDGADAGIYVGATGDINFGNWASTRGMGVAATTGNISQFSLGNFRTNKLGVNGAADATAALSVAGTSLFSGTANFNFAGANVRLKSSAGTTALDGFLGVGGSSNILLGNWDLNRGLDIKSTGIIEQIGNYAFKFGTGAGVPSGAVGLMKHNTTTGSFQGVAKGTAFTDFVQSQSANAFSNGTTSAPAASAQVDIVSTTKGFLPPRMTTAQRDAIASPATGLTLYCTDCTATDASTGVMQTYNGATWKNNW